MTARIYPIPARDVVPGMLLFGDQVVRVQVTCRRVTVFRAVEGRKRPACSSFSIHAEDVEVTLPGWSPRESLCSCCGGNGCGDAQEVHDHRTAGWRTHRADCPVHRLRLRLWPVGATWEPVGECWLLPISEHASAAVVRVDVERNFAPYPPKVAAKMRAAFYEPEVQPCHDCHGETDAGPCPGCGKIFCQPCAEKPYAFCCEPEVQP